MNNDRAFILYEDPQGGISEVECLTPLVCFSPIAQAMSHARKQVVFYERYGVEVNRIVTDGDGVEVARIELHPLRAEAIRAQNRKENGDSKCKI